MANCIRIVALMLIAATVSTAALLHWGDREKPAAPLRHAERVSKGRAGPIQPKIKGPAALLIDVAEGVAAGTPVVLQISTSSTIPVASGTVTLLAPEIAGEPGRTQVVWTGASSKPLVETVVCSVGVLPTGRYCFIAVFEFTSASENAEDFAISQCLYLDVRPTAILSSNVSFEQIKRIELRQELERSILASLRPKFAVASEDVVAREVAKLEAVDPGFMDRAIASLIATDSDTARRLAELNEHVSQPCDDDPNRSGL